MSIRQGRFVSAAAGALFLLGLSATEARAQGCVASRIDAPTSCPLHNNGGEMKDTDGTSYHLPKGRWQASFGYRWFMSHRHFVGSVEQNAENTAKGLAERDRSSTEVINHTHIPALSASFGISDRISLNADLPVLIARRKSPGNATRPQFSTDARGIGDLNLTARYWVGNPNGRAPQNLSFGLGIKVPTGNDRVEDDFLISVDPATGARRTVVRPVDQSIQPGDGGWGIIADLQAFKAFGRVTAFASGNYLSNPQEQNDFDRTPDSTNQDPITRKLSIADQFSARLGVGTALSRRWGVSLAARMEGVPSSDLIGGDLGRRRPGYSVAIEPGVSYSWKHNSVYASVPYLVRRVRTQALADKLESEETGEYVNGDAAFADYVVIVGFSRRF